MASLKQKLKGKKAVFLDLDNTLYAYRPCHEAGLAAAWRFFKKRFRGVGFSEFKNRYERSRRAIHRRLKGQAASHARLFYFQDMLESLEGKTDFLLTLRFEEFYWRAFLKCMRRHAWVLPFLKVCKMSGKKVVIVTNLTARIQFQKILKLGIGRYIDFLVTSEEAGVEKPHPKAFRMALGKAGVKARDAVILGDDPKADRVSFLDFVKV